jgi:hypothetical protein
MTAMVFGKASDAVAGEFAQGANGNHAERPDTRQRVKEMG